MFQRVSIHPTALLIGSTILSVALSVGMPFLFVRSEQAGAAYITLLVAGMLLAVVLPFALVIFSIVFAFSRRLSRMSRLQFVVYAYACIVFIFAGLYFAMTFYSDHEYAIASYGYYRASGQWIRETQEAEDSHLRPFAGTPRAFAGFNEHLWGNIYDEERVFPPVTFRKRYDREVELAELAQLNPDRIIAFRTKAVPEVLSDCLHLSVMTLATVGYGNLAPTAWYAKMATNVEALSGIALFVLALGVLFSGWQAPGGAVPASPTHET